MNMLSKFVKAVCIVAVLAVLGACSSNEDDLERYIYKTKLKKARSIEPLPKFSKPETFKYPENVVRRNPFKRILKKGRNVDNNAPDQNRPKMPLEQFPLDQLKFVGTLKDGATEWGLVADPNGRIVRVKPGDYMGENYGRIIRITAISLTLEESVKLGGLWKKKKTTFRLQSNN